MENINDLRPIFLSKPFEYLIYLCLLFYLCRNLNTYESLFNRSKESRKNSSPFYKYLCKRILFIKHVVSNILFFFISDDTMFSLFFCTLGKYFWGIILLFLLTVHIQCKESTAFMITTRLWKYWRTCTFWEYLNPFSLFINLFHIYMCTYVSILEFTHVF